MSHIAVSHSCFFFNRTYFEIIENYWANVLEGEGGLLGYPTCSPSSLPSICPVILYDLHIDYVKKRKECNNVRCVSLPLFHQPGTLVG